MSDEIRDLADEVLDELLGEAVGSGLVEVQGAGGATFRVLNVEEAEWLQETYEKYHVQYKMENVTDLQDLDRLLGLEMLSQRYSTWLLMGSDYDGVPVDEKFIHGQKERLDKEIRLLKKQMGVDRVGRTSSEQQSVSDYLTNLLRRAEEFGVHRNHQVAKTIDLWKELESKVKMYYRCDDEERRSEKIRMEDTYQWLVDVAFPEFNAIDDAFRQNQKYWVEEI